jgi:hypothetical protein
MPAELLGMQTPVTRIAVLTRHLPKTHRPARRHPCWCSPAGDESTLAGAPPPEWTSAPAEPDEPAAEVLPELPAPARTAEGIAAVLEADGCALLPGVIAPAVCARLAAMLAGYVPGTAGTGLTTKERDPGPRMALKHGGDMEQFGQTGRAELLLMLFQRDPEWLELLDPPPLAEAVDLALAPGASAGGMPHLINQSGWRNHPGHDAEGSLHLDEAFLPELPPELLAALPGFQPPPAILTALTYLVDVDRALCPTFVVPGSHRACRRPAAGESSWAGERPRVVLARAGAVLLFRSDVWHAGGRNRTDRTRYVVETVYGRRQVSQKFFPYLDFCLDGRARDAATPRQLRLLGGAHKEGNYG